MISGDIAQQLEETAALLREYPMSTEALRAIQTAENALAAAKAQYVAEMITSLDHETEGYSSPKTWITDQLRLDRNQANDLIKAADTMRDLPAVRAAATRGEISSDHVKLFGHALKHVGHEDTEQVVDSLVDVARTNTPSVLRGVVKKLRETVYPDSLEQAWIDGMAHQDIRLSPVPEGFHVTGFVNNELGASSRPSSTHSVHPATRTTTATPPNAASPDSRSSSTESSPTGSPPTTASARI